MKTAVVTDTNSGIFPEEVWRLGIFVLPMLVLIDGKTYYEGADLSCPQFYPFLANGSDASTSQPGPGDILPLWDCVLEEYEELVYIPMSSGLSASCQTAQGLALEYGGKVQAADNHRVFFYRRAPRWMQRPWRMQAVRWRRYGKNWNGPLTTPLPTSVLRRWTT